jgi:predicted acetyltransferase
VSNEVIVRELTVEDLPRAWELGRHAFGGTLVDAPRWALEPVPGVTRYGAFDRAGTLIGKANELHHEQWWDGRLVGAADIGGVAVAPEARGRGVSRALLRRILESGKARGAGLSALFPTVSSVYRASGWAVVGAFRSVDLPASSLLRRPPSPTLEVRPGEPADAEAADELYVELARVRNGLVSRNPSASGARRPGQPDVADGFTVVEDQGRMVGLLSWRRGVGVGADGVLTVEDFLASTPDAANELISVLASWSSVVSTVRLRSLTSVVPATGLPIELAREHRVWTWMHRPVDVVRAVSAREWPPALHVDTTFTLEDDAAPWNAGTWSLTIAHGAGHLERSVAPAAIRLKIDGFALLYCGRSSPRMLCQSGLLDAGPRADLDGLASLMATPPPELNDFF